MENNVSKKRIFFALLPLIIFNLVLILDMTVFKDAVWSQDANPYAWGENDRLYTNKKTRTIKNGDNLLFEYVGQDANCWEYDKEWQMQSCYEENKFGAQGSMRLGGNLIIDDAQALYMNGYDSSGHNWIMSTTSEPYGNALGAQRDRGTSLQHGNHMIVNGTMKGGAINFSAADGYVAFDEHGCLFVADGVYSDGGKMIYGMDNGNGGQNTLVAYDRPVCGDCMGSCSGGDVGTGYAFEMEGGTTVKGLTKVNGQVTMCEAPYNLKQCEKDSGFCCRKPVMMVDEIVGGFLGTSCTRAPVCQAEEPPDNCDHADCTYCYPQPYFGQRTPEDEEDEGSEEVTGGGTESGGSVQDMISDGK